MPYRIVADSPLAAIPMLAGAELDKRGVLGYLALA